MGDTIAWIVSNWTTLLEGLLAVLGAASIIAKLTPTTVDDVWIGKIINFIGLTKK